jgi:hypothetical protein
MEKECLDLLLRGTQPVVVCPARGIQSMRIPSRWRTPLKDGRLLVLSPFDKRHRRHTAELADQRNRFVGAIAHCVLVIHAAPQSKTERLCLDLLKHGKAVYALEEGSNSRLLAAGAGSTTVETIDAIIPDSSRHT